MFYKPSKTNKFLSSLPLTKTVDVCFAWVHYVYILFS